MAKFKVGDRVVKIDGDEDSLVRDGTIGTVSKALGVPGDVMVVWDTGQQFWYAYPYNQLRAVSAVTWPRPDTAHETSYAVKNGILRVWDRGGKQVVRCPVALWPTVREAVRNAAAELDAATKE